MSGYISERIPLKELQGVFLNKSEDELLEDILEMIMKGFLYDFLENFLALVCICLKFS